MRQVVLTGIRQMELLESSVPELKDGNEVKIKLKSIGVCGSDIHYYSEGKIGSQVVQYPYPVGHECSGIIEEIGESVSNVKVGDLVVIDPAVHCGICDQCRAGRPHTCRNNKFLGCPGQLDGCLADYIVMPDFTCFPVTGKLNAIQAALIEPLSIGVYTVKLAQIESKRTACAIFGAGPIGLSILMKLLADGIANTGILEPRGYRRGKALEIGAKYTLNPTTENVEAQIEEQEEL